MTKKKAHTDLAETHDHAQSLHNALLHLSQTVPPQVNMTDVLNRSTALLNSLEAAAATEETA